MLGGDQSDVMSACIWQLGGDVEMRGLAGDDNMSAALCDSALLVGGAGSDVLTGSNTRPDVLIPGSGVDVVNAGGGDDVVRILAECELERGKKLRGGPGMDTLVIPVSASELAARGVQVSGFEIVIVDDSNRLASDCFPAATP